ncbi:MAG: hypothetical protein H5U20_00730 [Rhodobacteraceae bacterium]|nr:hypothetical protein [Paracoccaceae bacterium]
MRPPLIGDAVAAARVLSALPRARRRAVLAALIARAEAGERFRRAEGRAHPVLGNGSLMAACSGWPKVAEPALSDGEWLGCLRLVLAGLARAQRRKPMV